MSSSAAARFTGLGIGLAAPASALVGVVDRGDDLEAGVGQRERRHGDVGR